MKLSLIPVLLLATQAYAADEAKLACDLEKSKAEVQASILAAPLVYGSVGEASATDRNVTVGISQSLSGRSRAKIIREAADATCAALKATVLLDEHRRWAEIQITKKAAKVELLKIREALELAQAHLAELDLQLAAQTITLSEHTAARDRLMSIEAKKFELTKVLSVSAAVPPEGNIRTLIQEAKAHESAAAGLTAKATAESGWDIVASAGAKQPIGGSSSSGTTPFASIGFRYSFGASSSKSAAQAVAKSTEALLTAQAGGYTQTASRQLETIEALLANELERKTVLTNHAAHVNKILTSLEGLDTAVARNTKRGLGIQAKLLEAEAVGIDARILGYTDLRDKLTY